MDLVDLAFFCGGILVLHICLRIPVVLAPITHRPHLAYDLVANNALVANDVAVSRLVVTHTGEVPIVYYTQPMRIISILPKWLSIIPNC